MTREIKYVTYNNIDSIFYTSLSYIYYPPPKVKIRQTPFGLSGQRSQKTAR